LIDDGLTAEVALAPAKPVGHPIFRVLLFVLASLLIQGGAEVLVMGAASLLDLQYGNELLLAIFVAAAPPIVLATALLSRWMDRRPLAEIGARWPRQAAREALALSAATGGLLVLWVLVIEALPRADVDLVGLSGQSPPVPAFFVLVLLLAGFLIQGGLEEWIVRGYVFRTLKERYRPLTAALACSLAFSLWHAGNRGFTWVAAANIALAGMILAGLVERSGSLWGATVAHGVWNFSVACLLSVPVSGVDLFHLLDVSVTGLPWLTGSSFGPEGSLVLTAIGLPLAVWLWHRPTPLPDTTPSPRADATGATLSGDSPFQGAHESCSDE
jgi:membrane protease YdiL (CAAX protease family)